METHEVENRPIAQDELRCLQKNIWFSQKNQPKQTTQTTRSAVDFLPFLGAKNTGLLGRSVIPNAAIKMLGLLQVM